jgi:hypothetical protein
MSFQQGYKYNTQPQVVQARPKFREPQNKFIVFSSHILLVNPRKVMEI